MATSNKVAMVLEAIAELFPMRRTKQVTRQDLKAWVTAHYAVELDDRWLDILLREHVVALQRHIERKKAQNVNAAGILARLYLGSIFRIFHTVSKSCGTSLGLPRPRLYKPREPADS